MDTRKGFDSFPPACRYWGKAASDEEEAVRCHLLVYHALDVAAVTRELLCRRPFLARRLSRLMGMPVEGAASLGVFLAGLHDLGKFAEAFQQLRPDLRQRFWPTWG